ncbi:hypothetical protein DICVIV_11722 [Dictyocaulus viviparus]|uniref:Uncharacterized protein n=1 Tax=Dictyocaulus viviparus TaxID=29172 RepID=A0A0D8XCH1_DICVI|nr:hypothetical protein DICVIV_11722 [Dictyocaulus viviparus]
MLIETNGCDNTSLLVRYDEYWPYSSTLVIYYHIRERERVLYEEHLVTTSVERWLQYDFLLHPLPGLHEVCVQMTSTPHLLQRLCRVIVNHSECPYPQINNSTVYISLTTYIIVLLSYFQR